MNYAKKADVRQRLLHEFLNRAYPANMAVLDKMIAKRYELARLLGFKTWAEYATRDKMIESDKNVASFIERLPFKILMLVVEAPMLSNATTWPG